MPESVLTGKVCGMTMRFEKDGKPNTEIHGTEKNLRMGRPIVARLGHAGRRFLVDVTPAPDAHRQRQHSESQFG